MKKIYLILLVLLVISIGIATLYKRQDEPNEPSETAVSSNTKSSTTEISVPNGFQFNVLADNVPGARVIAFDPFGNIWVSQTKQGTISVVEIDKNTGKAKSVRVALKNLNNPHGLAFDPKNPYSLYFAESNKISRLTVYSDDKIQKVIDLPDGGDHTTKTISFGPDDRLYVSIGSSCNVCNEADTRRATIYSLKRDGSEFKEFAKGLRNTVFYTWHPKTNEMWGADMGRDMLGDNIPADEINIIRENGNYGWPICYGKNVHDTNFDKNTYIRNPCETPFEQPSYIDLPAHSAPLGMVFVPESWPKNFANDLIVAFHGSWNRSVPTGYKLIRLKLDANGNYSGMEDFAIGWLNGGKVRGRPSGLTIRNGILYVADDYSGAIYQIRPE